VQRGDREAFTPLVERHERRVRSLVFHLVRRRDEVEDITQEIFIKAFKSIRGYSGESSFGTWLGRIAVNHCYDYLRREQKARVRYHWQMAEEAGRRMEENLEQQQPLSVEEEIALRDLAGQLLERAPSDDRVILTLKELEDRSIEEIAELLNLRVNTVKVRLHRARKRMLEDLKRWRQER
jgi:RNA polymerase sigma-70 factor (ECF subfamily)